MAMVEIKNDGQYGMGTEILVDDAPVKDVMEARLLILPGHPVMLNLTQTAGPIDVRIQADVSVMERCPYCGHEREKDTVILKEIDGKTTEIEVVR